MQDTMSTFGAALVPGPPRPSTLAPPPPARYAVLRLAWPICCTMMGETVMGLVDTKLVSNLGAAVLGGVGIANAVLYLSAITVMGLMRSVKICTAHAVGLGRPADSRRFAQVGFLWGLGLGLAVAVAMRWAPALLVAVGVNPDVLPPATDYLLARSWGVPAAFCVAALVEYRQGLSDVRLPMAIGIGGNVVNAVLAYSLIYGHLGFEARGVAGAGLGTSIAEYLQLAAMLAVLAWRRWHSRPQPSHLGLREAARSMAAVGLPTALHFFCEYLAFAACTGILASLGEVEVAAHQIVVVINRLAYLPGLAMGEVACILVSQALGAGRLDAADAAVRQALRLAVTFMVACGLGFVVFSAPLAGFFTQDPATASRVVHALWIAGVFQVLDATNVVMRGALRGARDVRLAAIMGVTILWACVPTVTFLLGHLAGWGVVGAWCSFLLETALCALVFYRRWYRGRWRLSVFATSELVSSHP
jgi:MATE family multidrug resistance protein